MPISIKKVKKLFSCIKMDYSGCYYEGDRPELRQEFIWAEDSDKIDKHWKWDEITEVPLKEPE